MFDFFRQALSRIERIRVEHPLFEERCDSALARNLRGLIFEPFAADIESAVRRVAQRRGIWLEGIEAIGDWLYFDRKGFPESFQHQVRALYDSLLPTDLIELARLYTKFWSSEIHNPDLMYDQDDDLAKDFEYSTRKAKETASSIATDPATVERAIRELAPDDLKNPYPFAYELAKSVKDPINLFVRTLNIVSGFTDGRGLGFVRGLLGGIDERDPAGADTCVRLALDSDAFRGRSVDIRSAVKISKERLGEIVESLRAGTVSPSETVYLSYGQQLAHLEPNEILSLVLELNSNHRGKGSWAALEIVSMYQHGRDAFNPELAAFVKDVVVSPAVLDREPGATRDGYLFETLVRAVHKHCGLDREFAERLSDQIVRICQTEIREVFGALDDAVRKLIKLLVAEQPEVLWSVIARFVERATRSERSKLNRVIAPHQVGFSQEMQTDAGPLFGIAEDLCFRWADAEASARAPFLCEFFPVFDKDHGGKRVWHPAMQRLAKAYGHEASFRIALENRLHVGSWSGSLIPYLEVYFEPLESWYIHSVPEISQWARNMRHQLDAQIARERKSDEEERI